MTGIGARHGRGHTLHHGGGVRHGHGAGAVRLGAGDPLGRGAGARHGVGDPAGAGAVLRGDPDGARVGLTIPVHIRLTDVVRWVCVTDIPE